MYMPTTKGIAYASHPRSYAQQQLQLTAHVSRSDNESNIWSYDSKRCIVSLCANTEEEILFFSIHVCAFTFVLLDWIYSIT